MKNIIAVDIEVEETWTEGAASPPFSQSICSAAVLKKNLIVQWDCVESNTASRMVAENAVSIYSRSAPYYWFEIS